MKMKTKLRDPNNMLYIACMRGENVRFSHLKMIAAYEIRAQLTNGIILNNSLNQFEFKFKLNVIYANTILLIT